MKKNYWLTGIMIVMTVMSAAAQDHTIGEKFGGGIIFYIDSTGQHGLIAAMADQKWANWPDAIRECTELRDGGFTDWRLPSKFELTQLNRNEDSIKADLNPSFYWSSTDQDSERAFAIAFIMDASGYLKKADLYFVRAVRSF